MIVMRIISSTKIKTNPAKDKKEITKTFLQLPEHMKVPIIKAMSDKFKKETEELNNIIKNK